MALPNPEQQYSYADYLTWEEGQRYEIIDGIVFMQATPTDYHQEISGELYRQIANYLQGKPCKVYHPPYSVIFDTTQTDNSKIKNVFEPDLTIVCDKTKRTGRGCKGTPDLIIEILSPSTMKNDLKIKFNRYEKEGVKEYWIISPDNKHVSVYTLQSSNLYTKPDTYFEDDKIKVSIFADLTIDLKKVFTLE